MKSEEIYEALQKITDGSAAANSRYTQLYFLGEIAAQLAIANEDRWPRWVWFSYNGNKFPINAKSVQAVGMSTNAQTHIYLAVDSDPWVVDGTVEEVCAILGIHLEGSDEEET